MKKVQPSENSFSEILLYTTPNGSVKVEIYLQDETIWLTQQKIERIHHKGVHMDDERLKNPHHIFGKDYFEEQLARIRDIRSSERRFYQKITDIFNQCNAAYFIDIMSEYSHNIMA